MYQIDVSTVSSTQPSSTALGTVGYFTDGNAATGVSATVVPAEFLNSVMLELMNVITGAGLTLSKTSFNQLFTAIQTIGQSEGSNYAADTGSANAYAASYSPMVSAPGDGMVRAFKVKTANTTASTFALDGSSTTYPIYGLAGTALQGGELVANGIAVIRYNGSLAGWVLITCSGGALQVGSATQSKHAITLGQAQAMQGNFGGNLHLTVNTTLTLAQLASNYIDYYGPSGGVFTLPSAATIALGKFVKFTNYGSGTLTIQVGGGSDFLYAGSGSGNVTSITLQKGDDLEIVGVGAAEIDVVGGSAARQFYPLVTGAATSASHAAQFGQVAAVRGAFSNLKLSATGTSATVNISADQIILRDANNLSYVLSGVALTPSTGGAVGTNSLDTGAWAFSTWYAAFAIYNPTTQTTAALFSLSATAPTLPSGYTAWARVGWIRTLSATSYYALPFTQKGRVVRYQTVGGYPLMLSSGSATSYTAIALATFIPTTASKIRVYGFGAGPAASWVGIISSDSINPDFNVSGNGSYNWVTSEDILVTGSSIYYTCAGTSPTLGIGCGGWEDSL